MATCVYKTGECYVWQDARTFCIALYDWFVLQLLPLTFLAIFSSASSFLPPSRFSRPIFLSLYSGSSNVL